MAGTKVVVHWNLSFQSGMAYVMLGQCQRLQDLYLSGPINLATIKSSVRAKEEMLYLDQKSQSLSFVDSWRNNVLPEVFKVCILNVRSLNLHIKDISVDAIFQNSDLLCFTETWVYPESNLPNLDSFRWKYGAKSGRGKESLTELEFIEEPDFQAIHGKNVSIGSFIVVYVQNQEKPWLRMTQRLSQRWLECQFITGDFNVSPDDNNPLFKLLDSQELC